MFRNVVHFVERGNDYAIGTKSIVNWTALMEIVVAAMGYRAASHSKRVCTGLMVSLLPMVRVSLQLIDASLLVGLQLWLCRQGRRSHGLWF